MALSAATLYLSALGRRTGGVLSPPLDDTWIYLQYARRLAEGHPFQYVDGSSASTGASSLLHLALLVPGWWLGFHGLSFAVWAMALGTGVLALALILAGRTVFSILLRETTPGRALGAALSVMVLLGLRGHVVWAALSGMDTILLAAALGAIATRVATAGPEPGRAWWMAGFLGFVRPEGIPLGFLTLLILWFDTWRARRTARGGDPVGGFAPDPDRGLPPDPARTLSGGLARVGTLLGAMALLLVPPLINWILTGTPQWDSMRVKGLWSETRPDVLATMIRGLPAIWGEIAWLPGDDFHRLRTATPVGLLAGGLVAVGFVPGWLAGITGRLGPAGRLMALWIPVSVLLGALSPGWHSHYYRYQIPILWPVTVLMVIGWWRLAARLPHGPGTVAPPILAAILALILAGGFWQMQGLYARNGANILEQQIRVGRWLAANTRPDTRVAVNDAGAIAYFGNRHIVDLVGLVSHGWSPASRQGSGALFERLESLPRDERPDLFAFYPRWFPQLAATHFAGPVLFQADLVDNTICGDRLKEVRRIDWSLAGTGTLPVLRLELIRDFGMSLVDSVDVADQASEAAHDYRWSDTFRDRLREFPTAGPDGPIAMDGGRWISAGESMRIRARPGQWLIMIMRTEGEHEDTLDVAVDGRPAGFLPLPRLATAWTEPLLQIPDSLVVDSTLTVTVRWRHAATGDGYGSYHYWFLQ